MGRACARSGGRVPVGMDMCLLGRACARWDRRVPGVAGVCSWRRGRWSKLQPGSQDCSLGMSPPPAVTHSFLGGWHLFLFAVSQAEGSAQGCKDKTLLAQELGAKGTTVKCDERSNQGPAGRHRGQEAAWGRAPGGDESEGQRCALRLSSGPDTGACGFCL